MSDWTDQAEKIAADKGLIVVRPQPNELFVDIDDADGHAVFVKHLPILGELVASHTIAPSPSGGAYRFHARVMLSRNVFDELERVFLQTLLGSDRLHEVLSWRAATRGVTGVTVFFEKPTNGVALQAATEKPIDATEIPW